MVSPSPGPPGPLRSLALSKSTFVALGGMLLVGFAPLFAGPGYESSLAAGLLVPICASIGSASWVAERGPSPREAIEQGALRGVLLGALAYLTTLLHGLRAGFCSVAGGSLLFLLGPFLGALSGGVWGAVAGSLARRVRGPRALWAAALALAALGPVGSALLSLLRGASSPIVFAFDPFAGFFSGTLYDTVIDGTDRLATYRLGTLCSLLFVAGAALHLERPGGARLARPRPRGWLSALTLAALLGSLLVTFEGSRLGHWQTPTTIREQLGAERSGKACHVIYPRAMRDEDAELFARDCDQQVGRVSAYLGVERPPRVTAYLFQDAAQKRRLMGAAETYIAKPWRREVYVQVAGYPHPVLGHELAHVIAGSFAPGPLHVAGGLRGFLPNPGLIEGIAVAASPDDDELSPEAWSRAMLELKILPPLRAIFSLGFLAQDAGRAYTVAGAFVGFVHDTFGAEPVRRWYGGEPIEQVTGEGWDRLEERFRRHVTELPIPAGALSLARARFDRPAIFFRACPHEVDERRREAAWLLGAGDVRGASRAAEGALALDRRDAGSLLLRASCDERLGDTGLAARRLEAIAADGAQPRTVRDRAEERLGDLALASGDLAGAAERYESVQGRVLDEDYLRTLDVKRRAAADPAARAAVVALLIGGPRSGPDPVLAAEELGRWAAAAPSDGLPLYLLARSALGRGQYLRAGAALDEALARGLSLPRVLREASRQRVIAGCAVGDAAAVARGLSAWTEAGAPPGNRDALLRALAARCL